MRVQLTKPLFAWDALEDSPTLKTIKQLLDVIPDQTLVDSLQAARGKGRDDVPVRVAWGVLVLAIALRHTTIEACLGELRRNESLRKLIGIDSEESVPQKWNLSRFLHRLGEEPHLTHLHGIFDGMIQRPGSVVRDLGRNTAGDATSLNARRKQGQRAGGQEEGLPQASGGRQEYTDDEGNVTKVFEWFGFKLHLLVDVKHEGWECPMSQICNAGKKYGMTVRVPREIDLRRFPPLPRATKKFERVYKGRTAVERVNARLKIFWGADDGNVTGSRRFFALLGVILVVHAAFATLLAMAPRWEGTLGQTRLSPIAKALYGQVSPPRPPRRRRQLRLRFVA